MYLAIKKVESEDEFLLILTFENGEKRKFDMKPFLNIGIFAELQDVDLFRTVKTIYDTIGWDNEADLDPEFLYQNSTALY